MSKMIRLSGLWENTSENGEKYYAGNLGSGKLMMFRNPYSDKDPRQPEWILYLAEKPKVVDYER